MKQKTRKILVVKKNRKLDFCRCNIVDESISENFSVA